MVARWIARYFCGWVALNCLGNWQQYYTNFPRFLPYICFVLAASWMLCGVAELVEVHLENSKAALEKDKQNTHLA